VTLYSGADESDHPDSIDTALFAKVAGVLLSNGS
jgi:hypothetical protein